MCVNLHARTHVWQARLVSVADIEVSGFNPVYLSLQGNTGARERGERFMSGEDKPRLIAVTACTAGIAHTYMAAEALKQAAEAAGAEIKVETQGTSGVENRISQAEADAAQAIILAHDVAIKDSDRFAGIPTVDVSAAAAIKNPAGLIQQALDKKRAAGVSAAQAAVQNTENDVPSAGVLIKDSVLTGISYIIPVIIAGGMISAICTIATQMFGLQELAKDSTSWLALFKSLGSGALGTLMVPILSAYMAYSLADKPGLGPGFIAGLAANAISSGFLGGMLGGLIAGFLMRWMKEHIHASGPARTFITFWLYPVVGSAVAGALMLFVAGPPVAALNSALVNFLNGLSGANAVILGAIIGAMVSFDLGGPVNKAAYAFAVGAMANGNLAPYCIFASVKMVSAFSCTAACMLRKDLFSEEEREIGGQTWMLGLAGITEGAIPFAMRNPVSVIGSFIVGSIVCGGIVGYAGIGLSVPGAGIFSLIALSGSYGPLGNGLIWLGAALVGSAISTALLIVTRQHKIAKENA